MGPSWVIVGAVENIAEILVYSVSVLGGRGEKKKSCNFFLITNPICRRSDSDFHGESESILICFGLFDLGGIHGGQS